MIAFPAAAAVIAALCAAFVGWDALRRPARARDLDRRFPPLYGRCRLRGYRFRDGLESDPGAGSTTSLVPCSWLRCWRWGRLYLLLPRSHACDHTWRFLVDGRRGRNGGLERAHRLGAITGGGLAGAGARTVSRALAATINAGGTIVLTGGALCSAWKLRAAAVQVSERPAAC